MHASDFLAMAAAASGLDASELSEVDKFIVENRLDEIAAQNLRAEASQIQRLVLDRGSLAECLNPSSAVIGRIRDAKLQFKYGSGPRDRDRDRDFDRSGGGGGSGQLGGRGEASSATGMRNASADEVEVFIRINRLDDTAARNLRAEPARVQAAVLDRGSLAECINPSSAVIGRIRDAKLQIKYGTAGRPAVGGSSGYSQATSSSAADSEGGKGEPLTAETVERFIVDNRLDDMAARNLRAEPPQVQAAVLARGSLAECLNPSSALIGRIRDAKLQVKYGSTSPTQGLGALSAAGFGGVDGAAAAAALSAAGLSAAGFAGLGLEGYGLAAGGLAGYGIPGYGIPGFGFGGYGAGLGAGYGAGAGGLGLGGLSSGLGAGGSDDPNQEVDVFIAENRLDDGAARALRAEIAEVQQEVMSRGSLLACTNPSSAVMGRIREARLQRNSIGSSYAALGVVKQQRSGPY